ncbi:ABC transporter ATP-binding protein [Ferrovibrio sp. MS7]|uniref:ABC transporter ATP-binding protein n=1 Tax=Ferrovibrio TaxID=1231242 RepID=UPI001B7C920C|nr:ABC transporter ATP-binding protein [Ferrovibrio sp.]
MTPTLKVENLETHFPTRDGIVRAVDGVSFEVAPGEILGLVGESGSGKSITGFSIIGLLDQPGHIANGRVLFKGEDIAQAKPARLRQLRGKSIAMIFQDPMMTLNPVLRVDTQMIEGVLAHEKITEAAARARCIETLKAVGIAAPEDRLQAYPHQLSGGMRQRIAIAIALLNKPELIIADEPTTALDVTIQGQILYEVRKLCRETGTALIWITHDLSVVAGLADRVMVMYAGRIVETGSVAAVIEAPRHPYTAGLIGSVPGAHTNTGQRGKRLFQIPGMTPPLLNLPPGCRFKTRCSRADAACEAIPDLLPLAPGHDVRCWHPLEGAA